MSYLHSIYLWLMATRYNLPAGILTLLTALIITTPLCNQLFACGCTWPWQGLDQHCNIHLESLAAKCPWCTSTLAASLSLGPALLLGYYLSMSNSCYAQLKHLNGYIQILPRFALGLTAFIVIASSSGLISAIFQGYPIN